MKVSPKSYHKTLNAAGMENHQNLTRKGFMSKLQSKISKCLYSTFWSHRLFITLLWSNSQKIASLPLSGKSVVRMYQTYLCSLDRHLETGRKRQTL